jgi:hypothetical protein
MIKLTVQQLVEAVQSGALGRLLALDKPIKVAWANRKQGTAATEELKSYDERRMALLKAHGTLAEGATQYTFADGEADKFQAGHAELIAQTVELPGEPVKLADLGAGRLSEMDLSLLEAFLTE